MLAPMPAFPTQLDTARLVLRPIAATDAEQAFREYAADPLVTRYLTWAPYQHAASCVGFFAHLARRHAAGEIGSYAITLRADGRMIGAFDIRADAATRVNFGYVLGRAHWRQGLMTEALTAVLDWALNDPDIWRIWAVTDIDNTASARTMEKAGMAREGLLRRWVMHPNIAAEPRDCICFARVR